MYPTATLVYFQLKYCERCACLWLRPDAYAAPYCPGCERIMDALPVRTPQASRQIVRPTRAPAALPLPAEAGFAQPGSVGGL